MKPETNTLFPNVPNEPTRRSPRILFANTNLAEARYAYLATPDRLDDFSRSAGYDGVEWHPWYIPAASVGRAIAEERIAVGSLHQSARTVWRRRGLADVTCGGPLVTALSPIPIVGRLFCPEIVASAGYMGKVLDTADTIIKTELGQEWRHPAVTGVFYPHPDADTDKVIRDIADTDSALAQPNDRLARFLGAATVEDVTDELLERGYGYWLNYDKEQSENTMPYVLNTHGARRRFGHGNEFGPISNLEDSLRHLVANSSAMQLSLGINKLARKEPHIPTMQELKGILDGEAQGELAVILKAFKNREAGGLPPLDYIVVDVPAGSVARTTGHSSGGDVQKAYATIATALKDYFE